LGHRPELIAQHDADAGANIPARREQRKRTCAERLDWGRTCLQGRPVPWKSRISVMVGLILDSLIT